MYVLASLFVLYLFCSALTSSQGWPLDCTPRKTVPYHSDNGKLFRENDVWNYTTMALREDLGLIFLGTRGAIFALDINNINNKKASVRWGVTEKQQKECTYKGKDPEIDCQNYIRILHGTEDGRMYVCGTNAFHPMCDYMNYTDGQLIMHNNQEDGKGKCPFDPFQRYSSVWVDGELYSATSMNFLGSEPVVMRSSEDPIRTDFKSSWLNEPNFIYMDHIPESENSPDGDDDKVYLFFSETAVEYDFYHKLAVSRVARVCKGDLGGQRTLQRKWTSFVKARLECPVLKSQLPYLVQDVFRVCPAGWTTCVFYAIFTPQMHFSDHSAVCAYSMHDIKQVFTEGKFKTPVTVETSFVKWVMFSGDLPTPRPGACINGAARKQGITSSLDLPDKTLQFIRDRPLMDQVIEPMNNRPLLVKKGAAFTRIVVASVVALDGATYHVMFIGTATGSVLKAVNYAEDNTEETAIIEELQLFQSSEAIKILRLSKSTGHLFAGSEVGVVQMPLSSCGRYTSCGDCVHARDPFCAWDLAAAQCTSLSPVATQADSKLIQNLQNGDASGCPPPETAKLVTRTFVPGNNVKLECKPISNLAKQDWYVGDKTLVLSDKYKVHNDSLMILNASAADAANYSCWSVERSHEHEYRWQKAKYQLTLGTNGDGRWVLPTSPQAQSSRQHLVSLQILVVLLSVMLALLVAWNFYKGHLTLPCKMGRGQAHMNSSRGEVANTQQPLQHTEEKTSAPVGNRNNNHANLENTISMDGHDDVSVI
ncbi:semaphorin-4E [Alosa sapidissima]|uniref:semaphorin-4E n=1 Tax=Alosa sapidissima TaxID=34773 RepID=UPI001C082BB1|nr:semaphorin-4E [Alosa sapidissima]